MCPENLFTYNLLSFISLSPIDRGKGNSCPPKEGMWPDEPKGGYRKRMFLKTAIINYSNVKNFSGFYINIPAYLR